MRPVVKVEPVTPEDEGGGYVGQQAVCHVPGCGWSSPVHVVKAGAVEAARWHRDKHRRSAS